MDPGLPYQCPKDLGREQRGINLACHLNACAGYVAAGNFTNADLEFQCISHLSSPDGDAIQRMAAYMSEALSFRMFKHFPGACEIIMNSSSRMSNSEELLVKNLFFKLCPFLKVLYLIINQAIAQIMEGEKMVHIIDLNASEPAQWINLLKTRKGGPPQLNITVIHEKKEVLEQIGLQLIREAENLEFPFRFNPIVSKLQDLDFEILPVKPGEALAISSVLQLHSLLAVDDEMLAWSSPAALQNLQRAVHMNQRTFGELIQKDKINAYILSPDSALSPLSLGASPKMGNFLHDLWKLRPKLIVITEHEADLNGSNLIERVDRASHYYGSLFDCLESTVPRTSSERQKLERMLFGEEIKNIIACEGIKRKERHEKLEKWIPRLESSGFGKISFCQDAMHEAKNLLQNYGHGFKLREENGCLFICWNDKALFSISAWRFR
ncbi:hypothetical protein L6164_017907 [Bauhinia variegata]|uniref:Uncharacterized protein n=1 Tax=Bauhinia variegata TaxID=167791 RepID=A0ACB9N9L3_BAUVA|nr:hypothetical protein L6164_017907 [Bauhinia variegata]